MKTLQACIAVLFAMNCGTTFANTVKIFDEAGDPLENGGTQYSASCAAANCVEGFYETNTVDLDISAVLSSIGATGYDSGANRSDAGIDLGGPNKINNPTRELAFLNLLLDSAGISEDVTFVDKSDNAAGTLTTNREYFAIKQGGFHAFFRNVSGGSVTVEFNPENFSHHTVFGDIVTTVPLPGSLLFFGTALLGLSAWNSRKRRRVI